jgi:hypothetical protein
VEKEKTGLRALRPEELPSQSDAAIYVSAPFALVVVAGSSPESETSLEAA